MSGSWVQKTSDAITRARRLALVLLRGPGEVALEARAQLERALVPPLRTRVYRIDHEGPDLVGFVSALNEPYPILFVHGFDLMPDAARAEVETRLNLLRDAFGQQRMALIFWIPDTTFESFLQHCPDLFAWRALLEEIDERELPGSPAVWRKRRYLARMIRGLEARTDEYIEPLVQSVEEPETVLPFFEWATNIRRGVVIGAAGSGKTTLVHLLARRLADNAYEEEDGPVPVVRSGGDIAYPSMPLPPSPESWLEVEDGPSPDEMKTSARRGKLILLFDALDEVYARHEGAIIDALNELSTLYPDIKMIVTTRSAVPGALRGWEAVRISPFTQPQIALFSDMYLKRHLGELDEAAIGAVKSAIVDSGPGVLNPLFFKAWLDYYIKSGRLPLLSRRAGGELRRVEFLSLFIDQRLEDVDAYTSRSRGLQNLINKNDLRMVLSRLALGCMSGGSDRLPRQALLSELDAINIAGTPDDLIEVLVERSGLLREAPPGDLQFVHRTVEECLAAEAIIRRRAEDAFEILAPRLRRPAWTPVLIDAVALLETRASAGAGFLDDLISHVKVDADLVGDPAVVAALLRAAGACEVWSETLDAWLRHARSMMDRSPEDARVLEEIVGRLRAAHPDAGAS